MGGGMIWMVVDFVLLGVGVFFGDWFLVFGNIFGIEDFRFKF